ncbi:MAG: hypothetical protein AB4368_16080 [Xenococcaceae cyanobacterium]
MKKRTRVTRRAHREMSALFNSSGLLIGLILVLIGVIGNRSAIDKVIFWAIAPDKIKILA